MPLCRFAALGHAAAALAAVTALAAASGCTAPEGGGSSETLGSGDTATVPTEPPPTGLDEPPGTTEAPGTTEPPGTTAPPGTTEPPPTTTEPPPTLPPQPPAQPPPPPPTLPETPVVGEPPTDAQFALLRAIGQSVKSQAGRIEVDAPEGLRAGEASPVTLTLVRPYRIGLPPLAKRAAEGRGRLLLEGDASLVAGETAPTTIAEAENPITFQVRIATGKLLLPAGETEIGLFSATPKRSGGHYLWLRLQNPAIDGRPLRHPGILMPLRPVDVARAPLGPTIEEWLLRGGAIAGALLAITGVLGWFWRRKKPEPSPPNT